MYLLRNVRKKGDYMYYLNDEHPEYEYALYCRVGSATPYIVRKFESMEDICRFIQDLEKRNNRYHRIFYIDNDFYNNYYNINENGIYYKFLRRKLEDWQEFTTNDDDINKNILKFYLIK